MSEEPATVSGPPKSLPAGIVKALRPRQWVKNVLVLAAPIAAGTATEATCCCPSRWRSSCSVWRHQASISSTTRWMSKRPCSPHEAVPSHRGRRSTRQHRLRHGSRAACRCDRAVLPGQLATRRGHGRVHRHPARLLLRSQASGRHRHLHRLVRLPASSDRPVALPPRSISRSGSC